MAPHYNAFISYRHHPVDSRVAGEVQRALEHFYVPVPTRKKTGVSKISRVFRDKEELPITSNLSDDITQALAGADFLIVICSPRTSDSVWVLREIKEFLRTHSRQQVLTVLADGEPQESIPDILTWEDGVDPQTGETCSVPLEPLSCDWRLPRRQALREELPRLASALLGCAYDDLRMRQRQYRTRRLVCALSAALVLFMGLGFYYWRTSMIIKENYMEALRNQSNFLASSSQALLDEGDRITATQLALAALPDEEGDRPLVPEAEYALGQAIGAYTPPQKQDPKMVGAFVPNGKPKYFLADRNGMLYILSENNTLSAWDAYSFQTLATFTPDFQADKFFLAPGGLAVLWGQGGLACCERDTGTLVWQTSQNCSAGAILSPDGSVVTLEGNVIRHFSLENGVLLWETQVEPTADEKLTLCFPAGDSLSPDGRLLALYVYTNSSNCRVLLYNLESRSGTLLQKDFYSISDICFTSADRLVILGRLEACQNETDFANSNFLKLTVTQRSELDAVCLSSDGEILWRSSVPLCQASHMERLFLCPNGETLLCMAGGTFARLDCGKGNLLGWCECTGSILNKVSYDDEKALVFLDGGEMCIYTYENDVCTAVKYFPDQLYWAFHSDDGSYYLSQTDADRVLAYRYNVADDEWEPFSGEAESIFSMQTVTNGELLAVFDMDRSLVHLYDLSAHTLLFSVDLSEHIDAYSANLAGFSGEQSSLLLISGDKIIFLSTADGSVETFPLPKDAGGGETGSICSNSVFMDGQIVYALQSDSKTVLCFCSPGGRNAAYSPLSDGTSQGYMHLFPFGTKLLCLTQAGDCLFTDISTGEVQQSAVKAGSAMTAAWSPDGSMAAILGDSQIYLTDNGGSLILELSLTGQTPLSCCFSPSGSILLFVGTDGQLHRYTTEGDFLGSTKLPFDTALSLSDAAAAFKWNFEGEDDLLLIHKDVLMDISCSEWAVRNVVKQCIFFNSDAQEFVSYSNSGSFLLGCFPYYSTQELIEKGRALIGDVPLSEETGSAYGLTAK